MINVLVANYVRDVLQFDETKIIIGRLNFIQDNYSTDRIYIDTLAPRQNLGSNENFDGDLETMKYITTFKQVFTIDFIGPALDTNVNDFINLQNSERAILASEENSIRVLLSNNINNVKDLKGKIYYNRTQLEIMVTFSEQTEIDVPRFDTAQTVLTIDL